MTSRGNAHRAAAFFALALWTAGPVFSAVIGNTDSFWHARADTTITLDELAKHNTAQSLYVSIFDMVYDFTEFAKDGNHGGGPEALIAVAGKNATSAFLAGAHADPIPADVKAGTASKDAASIKFVGKLASAAAPAASDKASSSSSSSSSSISSSSSSTASSTPPKTPEHHNVDDPNLSHGDNDVDDDGAIIDYVTVTKSIKTLWVTSTTTTPITLTTTTVIQSTSVIVSTVTATAAAVASV